MPSFLQFATAFNETLNFDTSSVMHKTPSYVSIDESSPTYLGAGSDARSLTVVSATLGGAAILFGRPFVAEEIQSQTAGGASAASALWTLCIRELNYFKAVQLRVTSAGGNLSCTRSLCRLATRVRTPIVELGRSITISAWPAASLPSDTAWRHSAT